MGASHLTRRPSEATYLPLLTSGGGTGSGIGPGLGHEEEFFVADRGFERSLLPLVGHQLAERPRIDHRAGKRVAADLLALSSTAIDTSILSLA